MLGDPATGVMTLPKNLHPFQSVERGRCNKSLESLLGPDYPANKRSSLKRTQTQFQSYVKEACQNHLNHIYDKRINNLFMKF